MRKGKRLLNEVREVASGIPPSHNSGFPSGWKTTAGPVNKKQNLCDGAVKLCRNEVILIQCGNECDEGFVFVDEDALLTDS